MFTSHDDIMKSCDFTLVWHSGFWTLFFSCNCNTSSRKIMTKLSYLVNNLVGDNRATSCGSLYWHGLTLYPAWISNYIEYRVWNEITYPLLNCNSAVDISFWYIFQLSIETMSVRFVCIVVCVAYWVVLIFRYVYVFQRSFTWHLIITFKWWDWSHYIFYIIYPFSFAGTQQRSFFMIQNVYRLRGRDLILVTIKYGWRIVLRIYRQRCAYLKHFSQAQLIIWFP